MKSDRRFFIEVVASVNLLQALAAPGADLAGCLNPQSPKGRSALRSRRREALQARFDCALSHKANLLGRVLWVDKLTSEACLSGPTAAADGGLAVRNTQTSLATAALALALIWGPAAHAGTVLSDNFNNENGGASAVNYAGFANWNSTGAGYVNLVASGGGITCAGGGGSCVAFDGTAAPGKITTKQSYAFSAGQEVVLSFDYSGNQVNSQSEFFRAGFRFGSPTDVNQFTFNLGGATNNTGDYTNLIGASVRKSVSGSKPWTYGWISFIAADSGTVKAFFDTTSTDAAGPLLDNVNLSIGAPLPEPSTWAMLLLGFGGIGAAMRRGRRRDGAVHAAG